MPVAHALLPISADVTSVLHQELEANSTTAYLPAAPCTDVAGAPALVKHMRQRHVQFKIRPTCLHNLNCLLLSHLP